MLGARVGIGYKKALALNVPGRRIKDKWGISSKWKILIN
nr:MAG TPA: hypothetical protein [Caudoviricetes sp.]